MKVLIAEDDKHIGEGLCAILEAEGYWPLLASDGEQALALFHAEDPQVILLDIMMPKRDGYTVCREIRKTNTHVPVIFISAKSVVGSVPMILAENSLLSFNVTVSSSAPFTT